jgi:hypothetical protein
MVTRPPFNAPGMDNLRYCHQHSRWGVMTRPLGRFSTASQARQ